MEFLVKHYAGWTDEIAEAATTILAVLSEGREASAPFAEAGKEENGRDRWPHHDDDTLVESSHALVELTAGDFRRLAAFNELVSQEKPDDPA